MANSPYRPYGVLSDAELVQRVAGAIDPMGQLDGVEDIARNVIKLVRSNMTCIGDMERGCY